MKTAADLHSDQISYWNNTGGEKWASAQGHTDIMLAPVADALMTFAKLTPGMAVLDIGCGCGATTIEIAKAVGPAGRVLAIDVSEPMLTIARGRMADLPRIELTLADAATYDFTPTFDVAVSRFGVMFFGDPVTAFANLRRALKPGGRLAFVCWRKLEENPWMQTPLHAVYGAGVPRVERPGPEEPGPFSFADPDRVRRILVGAGFSEPRLTPADFELDIAAGGGLAAAVKQALTIGAASRALQDQPLALVQQAAEAVGNALRPFERAAGRVELPAAVWLVESEPA